MVVSAEAVVDLMNRQTYDRPEIVRYYRGEHGLQPAESVILNSLRTRLAGKRLLDIGIGGGRTISHLLRISPHYTGVDVSAGMVAISRERFPECDLRKADVRDLSMFADQAFDFVLFSFNGLDYIGHFDRLRALREIRRVLAPGGVFVFSSHNLDAYRPEPFPWSWNPLRLAKRSVRYALGQVRRWQKRRLEEQGTDYAILVDSAHDYRLLTYYIGADAQRRQLRQAGFKGGITAYAADGRPVERDDQSPWIYYCVDPLG